MAKDLESDYIAFRAEIIKHGGVIKSEETLKMNYIFRKGVMPDNLVKRYVSFDKPAQSEAEKASPTQPQPTEKKKEETVSKEQPAPGGHADANPRNNRNNNQGERKPRKTKKEYFDGFKQKLEAKGVTINDEAGLFELFKATPGRLDYGMIGDYVTWPNDRNKDDRGADRKERKPREDRNNERGDKKENNNHEKTRFDEYRESLQAQGYEIVDQNALARLYNQQKGFISPEQLKSLIRKAPENKRVINNATVSNTNLPVPADNKLPVIVEGSFADKWIKPLQKWCDTDRGEDGKVKRILTAVKADNHSVIIDIVPTGNYAKENKNDAGAQYSFTKKDNNGNIESTLGSKDGTPLDYEYFRQLMVDYRKNNIQAIAFKDIQTDEFRDKLLAAALEFDMKMIGAPEKVDVNAPYLKKLPAAVKIKIGVHNGDISAKRNSATNVKESLKKHQENQPEDNGGKANIKPQLALPAFIKPREMD